MGKKHGLNRFRPEREPDWRGIRFVSKTGIVDPLCIYRHDGYVYCTYGEMVLARLLTQQGIAFTPDVQIMLNKHGMRSYVPDFVFNGDTYVWTEAGGQEIVIHGIECKGAARRSEKAGCLYGLRGIHILVMSEAEIDECARRGELPLRMLRRKAS